MEQRPFHGKQDNLDEKRMKLVCLVMKQEIGYVSERDELLSPSGQKTRPNSRPRLSWIFESVSTLISVELCRQKWHCVRIGAANQRLGATRPG
jgi:hypothetical protein